MFEQVSLRVTAKKGAEFCQRFTRGIGVASLPFSSSYFVLIPAFHFQNTKAHSSVSDLQILVLSFVWCVRCVCVCVWVFLAMFSSRPICFFHVIGGIVFLFLVCRFRSHCRHGYGCFASHIFISHFRRNSKTSCRSKPFHQKMNTLVQCIS